MKLKLKNIKKANGDLHCCFKDLLYLQQNTLKGIKGEVIVDLMTHNYPLIGSPLLVEGIRMVSLQYMQQ
jgi:hypothetical protein